MAVERYGFGEAAVVLLHGFGYTSFLWRHLGPELAVRGHVAVAPDLFGYGASDRPFDADFGIRAQANYIRKVITALGLKEPAVVACDVAALIALRMVADDPQSASRLVLVSPAAIDDLPGAQVRLMQRQTARHVLRLVGGLFGAEPLIRILLETSVTDPSRIAPQLVGRYVAPFLGREGVNHLLVLAHSLISEDLQDISLQHIRHSTLILRGSDDQWCTKEQASQLGESLADARIEVIPASGRLVAEERAGTLARVVLEHLAAQRAA